MEKIRVNRSSTQEELRKYRKCSLFNDERETTRAKIWRAKTSIACAYSPRTILSIFNVFVAVFFLSVKFFESCGTTDIFFCVYEYLYLFCLWISAVALSLNFTHHDVFFFVQYCLFTINCVFLLFNKV